ncbi:MAG: TetR/AcrR family transcriptional regulator [Tenericutes bacterium]|nr:TetR/AcrR family transcriptional regulator [Mycoplasmatota bacterium]
MPKETFQRINSEKRKAIIAVGEKLFSKKIYEEVDVKMIVEAANIPRGSFYAYFENIQDYYLTVVKTLQEERIMQVKKIKSSNNLSFFEVLRNLFESDITISHHSEKKLLIQHYFRYTVTQNLGFHEKDTLNKERPIFEVLDSFKDNYKMPQNEWRDFLDLCMNTYLLTYMKAIDNLMSIDESLALFKNRFQILERGIK